MKESEFYELWLKKSEKLNYALLSLTFASLALSFQFSPKMGTEWRWVLISSWLSFLISAICGGCRLVKEVSHMRLNYYRIKLDNFIAQRVASLGNPQFIASARTGQVRDHMTGQVMTLDEINRNLEEEKAKIPVSDAGLKSAARWMSELFQAQFWTLVGATLLSGIFVAKNLLSGAACQ